mmetsp:Transcript_101225/g.216795  ORF Transcript_101225/g.216795 Transcript_101225/m.216795 type:complete len:224 (-) Transcript_101225:135-806(-)
MRATLMLSLRTAKCNGWFCSESVISTWPPATTSSSMSFLSALRCAARISADVETDLLSGPMRGGVPQAAMALWPSSVGECSGVLGNGRKPPAVESGLSASEATSTWAFALSKTFTATMLPSPAHMVKQVSPLPVTAFTQARNSRRQRKTGMWPPMTARCRAVWPAPSRVAASMSAEYSTSIRHIPTAPCAAAIWSAERPQMSVAPFTSVSAMMRPCANTKSLA